MSKVDVILLDVSWPSTVRSRSRFMRPDNIITTVRNLAPESSLYALNRVRAIQRLTKFFSALIDGSDHSTFGICSPLKEWNTKIVYPSAQKEGCNHLIIQSHLLTYCADRGWQRSEGLLLLHSFLSLDILAAFSILRFGTPAKSVSWVGLMQFNRTWRTRRCSGMR